MAEIINFSSFTKTSTLNQYIPYTIDEGGSVSTDTGISKFKRPLPVEFDETPFISNITPKRKYAAEPLKKVEDIDAVKEWMLSHEEYRNNLIFTMGINFGLRCGDLLTIRIGDILDPNCCFRQEIVLREQKTGKERKVFMNDATMDAAALYLSSIKTPLNPNAYLFQSESNNNTTQFYEGLKENCNTCRGEDSHISRQATENMLKRVINQELGINVHAGTHLMRKTFAYHLIMNAPDRSRAIEFLQKAFGHSSQSITLAYAGITDEEIMNTCQNLNLGYGKEVYYASGIWKKESQQVICAG